MDSKTLKKYAAKSEAALKKIAQEWFNKYIRLRDKDEACISCKLVLGEQAGHFFSAGHYQALRFNEDNCHSQCVRCNYFLSGNLNKYRVNLEKKIGKESLMLLDLQANKSAHKWNRFELIEIIERYKFKCKQLK
jgi:hypothetical protein